MSLMSRHLSPKEFHEKFYESGLGQIILEALEAPESEPDALVKTLSEGRYKNNWLESLNLLVKRELLLWWRDKYQIKAKIAQSKPINPLQNLRFVRFSRLIHLLFFFVSIDHGNCRRDALFPAKRYPKQCCRSFVSKLILCYCRRNDYCYQAIS